MTDTHLYHYVDTDGWLLCRNCSSTDLIFARLSEYTTAGKAVLTFDCLECKRGSDMTIANYPISGNERMTVTYQISPDF